MIRACAPVSRMNAALLRKLRFMCVLFLCSILVIGSRQQLAARTAESSSEVKTTEGTEFWLCFQRNFKDTPVKQNEKNGNELTLELYVSSSSDTKVSIDIEGIKYQTTVKVSAGTVEKVVIDAAAEIKHLEIIKRLAIHILSDNPVTVYGLSSRYQTTDAFLGLPVSVLGKEYMAMGYKYSEGLLSQFAIIATEEETVVTITPTANTSTGHAATVPFSVSMRKGDVFQVSSHNETSAGTDLTGSKITSNKNIAVFSGHQCAYVPEGIVGCNHLAEQMPPITSWGEMFIVGKLFNRSKYTVRVLAHQDNTQIYLNSELVGTLNAGEVYENSELTGNTSISSSRPVLVAQYSQGFLNNDYIGDPMMLLVTPTEQFMSSYRFATPKSGDWYHYVNVTIPTAAVSSIRIDGKPLDANVEFQQVANSMYSIAQLNVSYGTHTISADQSFGMYSYGFGYGTQAYDAYGTMGGQSFNSLDTGSNSLKNK